MTIENMNSFREVLVVRLSRKKEPHYHLTPVDTLAIWIQKYLLSAHTGCRNYCDEN